MGSLNVISSACTFIFLSILCLTQHVGAGSVSPCTKTSAVNHVTTLSPLYLNCTTFEDMSDMSDMFMKKREMDIKMMGITSDECCASNTPWLQTMAYCIQQNCNADGYSTEKQAECFANQALMGASEPTFQESLPAIAPTVELADDALWLNETSLVNAGIYHSTHGTLGEFARSEYIHTRYAVILSFIVISVCTICGIFAQTRNFFPGFQKRLQESKNDFKHPITGPSSNNTFSSPLSSDPDILSPSPDA